MKKENFKLFKEAFSRVKNMPTSTLKIMTIFMLKIINSTIKEIKEILSKGNKTCKTWVNFMRERIQWTTHKMNNLFRMSQEENSHR
jgi:hypothetical protein